MKKKYLLLFSGFLVFLMLFLTYCQKTAELVWEGECYLKISNTLKNDIHTDFHDIGMGATLRAKRTEIYGLPSLSSQPITIRNEKSKIEKEFTVYLQPNETKTISVNDSFFSN